MQGVTRLFRAVVERDMEGACGEAEGRAVHAGGDDVGEGEGPTIQLGRGREAVVHGEEGSTVI
jgi:hypothetical protein